MKNNNQGIIRKLSTRSLKQNRMRNLFAIAAIALTTLLFTGLFTVGQGMIQLQEEQTMRQVGTKAHSGLKGVTMEECEKIVDNPLVVDWDYHRVLGYLSNAELSKRQTQLECTNLKNMKNGFKELSEGRLPESEDEIVMDDITLSMLGLSKKLGTTVDLQFDFLGQEYSKTFTLCGWYEGDKVAKASSVYISESYFKTLCNGKTDEELRQIADEENLSAAGLVEVSIFFANSSNIEEKTIQVIEEAGYEAGEAEGQINYGVNWAYLSTNSDSVDVMTIGILIVIILVILTAGYLIIYNIFQISIMKDIKFYGLLKTIGTTKQQISRLVRRQAAVLSCIGIPIGLVLGYVIGLCLIPTIFSMVELSSSNFHMQFQPVIFIFSTIFSIVTVIISCHKPGKIAGKVSPIEATKYQEVLVNAKGSKKRRQFGIAAMAFSNLKRSKKKTLLVVLSLSFSVIILVEIVTFSKSFSISKYLQNQLTDDITLGTAFLYNASSVDREYTVDEDYYNYVKNLEGVKRTDEMYTSDSNDYHYLSDSGYENYKKYYEQGLIYDVQYTHDNNESVVNNRTSIDETRYAYSEDLLDNLKVVEGTIDLEKFRTGNYILVGTNLENDLTFYHPGDKVTLQYQTEDSKFLYDEYTEGQYATNMHYEPVEEKEYEVMAVVEIPIAMTTQRFSMNALISILPIDEFKKMDLNAILFSVGVVIEDNQLEAVETQVKDYTTNVNPQMDYVSKSALSEEFSSITRGYLVIGGAIAVVIGIIGVLNFVNTMMTSVITRQRELAMLQSIGLTDSQMKGMLVYEGMFFILATIVVSFLAGSVISVVFIQALNRILNCFEYQFVVLPYVIIFPLLIVVAYLVPYLSYRNIQKYSLIERLRQNE